MTFERSGNGPGQPRCQVEWWLLAGYVERPGEDRLTELGQTVGSPRRPSRALRIYELAGQASIPP
jgi:hypothetical protein